jgi:S1-C subfamily serine protease
VVLGVTLKINDESGGLSIGKVHKDSGASEAGLEPGDIILEADGIQVKSMEDLQEILGKKEPGDRLKLRTRRADEEQEREVELKKRESIFEEEKTRNDAMSGRVSQRRSNFPRVLQTDLPLSVRSVGGPLLDLEGKCIGMNIARANRCETFAIPAKELREIIKDLMNPAQGAEGADEEEGSEDSKEE